MGIGSSTDMRICKARGPCLGPCPMRVRVPHPALRLCACRFLGTWACTCLGPYLLPRPALRVSINTRPPFMYHFCGRAGKTVLARRQLINKKTVCNDSTMWHTDLRLPPHMHTSIVFCKSPGFWGADENPSISKKSKFGVPPVHVVSLCDIWRDARNGW